MDVTLTPKDENDRFGVGYHEEWIGGEINNGGVAALMISFAVPQRIAIRYTPPDAQNGDVVVQSIGVEELFNVWVAHIERTQAYRTDPNGVATA